jgi:hypothetical protein
MPLHGNTARSSGPAKSIGMPLEQINRLSLVNETPGHLNH